MSNKILIVDPFSSGTIYAENLSKLGYECIAVLSSDKISEITKKSFSSDFFLHEKLFTPDEVKGLFPKSEIKAVIIGAESGVLVGEVLADYFNVNRNSIKTSRFRRDKFEMQSEVKLNNLKYIFSKKITQNSYSLDDLPLFDSYVLKPTRGASTQDVSFYSNIDALKEAVNHINWSKINATGSANDEFIVQEFIEGQEYVVDLVSFGKGNYIVSAISKYKKGLHNGSSFVYERLDIIDPNDAISTSLVTYAKKVSEALDFSCGPIHMEIMLTKDGPVLIEVGARLHGGIAPFIFEICYSPSLVDLSINSYLKKTPENTDLIKIKDASIIFGINENDNSNIVNLNEFKESILGLKTFSYLRIFSENSIPKTRDLLDCPFIVGLTGNKSDILFDENQIRLISSKYLK